MKRRSLFTGIAALVAGGAALAAMPKDTLAGEVKQAAPAQPLLSPISVNQYNGEHTHSLYAASAPSHTHSLSYYDSLSSRAGGAHAR